jgi:hypothetical protein
MRPKDLSEEQLAFVMLEVAKRRGDELDRDLFLKAMAETTPALHAHPCVAIERDSRAAWLRLMAALNLPVDEDDVLKVDRRTQWGRARAHRAKEAA